MGQGLLIASIVAVLGSAVSAEQPVKPNAARPAPPTAPRLATTAADLPAEPVRSSGSKSIVTLRDAAQSNDYATFDAIYAQAVKNGEDVGAFADLHEVWNFAETNAAGAFYGSDMHDRLTSRYPDYAKYIEDYRISDRSGRSFYPSRETRAFLLEQAIEGNDPVVTPAPKQPQKTAVAAPPAAAPAARGAIPPPKAVVSSAHHSATVLIEPPEPLPSDALANDMRNAARPPQAANVTEARMIDSAATTRGIFLIILGLIGIGVLTMTMQASSSDKHVADDESESTLAARNDVTHQQPTRSHG